MKLDNVKESFGSFWDSVTEGWRHLRESAASALTAFKPGADSQVPSRSEVDDDFYLPMRGWSMLGGELFEDADRLVARLEVPGMEKEDLHIDVLGDVLVVSGEKRFQREGKEGRWRLMQCAYGRFRREIRLPVPVAVDRAQATYRNGVLRVELPKEARDAPRRRTIEVA